MPTVTVQQAFDLALQHYRAGRPAEAGTIYRTILTVQPTNAIVHANLGEALLAMRRIDEAIACFQRAIELQPQFSEAHLSLGNALREKGQLDGAIAAYTRATECKPGYAEAFSNLGGALGQAGRADESVAAYRRALEFLPNHVEIWNNLASELWDQKRLEEASAASRRALELDPNSPKAFHILGNVHWKQGHLDEAIANFQRALQLQPDYPEVYNNLGVVLTNLGRLDDAVLAYRQALQFKIPYAIAHNNLGNTFTEQRRLDEAGAEYRRARELDPNYAEPRFGQALLSLLQGDFEQGWPLYEFRWEAWQIPRRQFPQPLWDGTPLHGRRLLLHAEQGFGDAIQFIRYAPMIAAQGGEVVVECPQTLVELFRNANGVHEVVATGDPLPPFDLHLPMLNQPLIFKTTPDTIPRQVPYLSAESIRREEWRKRLGIDRARLQVGLVWAGRPQHRRDRIRNIPYSMLLPLLRVKGIDFHSLHVSNDKNAEPELSDAPRPIDHTQDLHDFADTAALMAELDLILSVDTAAAHLAGALARPVWTLLPFVPDWRWGLEGERTPWYSTMRLFRQPALGDWPSLIASVATELEQAVTTRKF